MGEQNDEHRQSTEEIQPRIADGRDRRRAGARSGREGRGWSCRGHRLIS
jgi:hypothetical protein